MMGISENIRILRECHNLTQAEFGVIAGVSDKAVSTWENGSAEPRTGAIQRIADHFGLTKSALIEDGALGETITSPLQRQLLSLLEQLNEDGQRRVLNYAEDLVASGRYEFSADNLIYLNPFKR